MSVPLYGQYQAKRHLTPIIWFIPMLRNVVKSFVIIEAHLHRLVGGELVRPSFFSVLIELSACRRHGR